MKKYLNKNIFYQGDTSILLPLSLCYIVALIFLKSGVGRWGNHELYDYLYNNNFLSIMLSFDEFSILIIYIIVVYIISVGIFKKKKWSTLLSGPFTRKDIRRREVTIVVLSVLVFIGLYLIVVGQLYIQKTEIIHYLGGVLFNIVFFDLIRMIGVAFITVGGLFLLDSIFSNFYMLVTGVIFAGVYLVSVGWNLLYFISYKTIGGESLTTFNNMRFWISSSLITFSGQRHFSFWQIHMSDMIIVFISLVVIGCICGVIAYVLTNKIKVENMNDGIMFKFSKRIARFMLCTIGGFIVGPYTLKVLSRNYVLQINQELLILITIILVLTMTSVLVLRVFEKKLGKKILC